MRKLFLIGVLAAGICLLALFLFFNYLRPALLQEKNVVSAENNAEEVPVGYFDLRGIEEVLVDIKEFDFNPRRIVISPGTKVLWKNSDRVFHSVNLDSQPAGSVFQVKKSGQLKTGELFTVAIEAPGTYTYNSADNPETMTGIIIVK